MADHATVSLINDVFVARLGDRRRIKHADLDEMACALSLAGVLASDVRFEWRAGLRMITAGQQVALSAEMRRLQHQIRGLTIAA
jgi:hypothetical protein